MNVALEVRNSYENFILVKDIMYFRVGEHGLVSFHGKNYHIKKRMSIEQIHEITTDSSFFKVNTDCYVNTRKIKQIKDGKVFFEIKGAESKFASITKLRQYRLKEIVQQHKTEVAAEETVN
ncbi:transcriptional regulator, LytTR family [Paenibacillus sp. yr247]|uniref:LytTR family transcriptional regulator DNA-binding domain-containing protein n=1 Tax=Paenibacillus sp. yr247 TaxID=1761880 RepID=UPI0008841248|nr:LytTR family transcriptional regulator DNA-binding domain-containing protein [Paenibacillus sp. yr247]SDN53055.1 transcriptional regulator, LytTR family [Paenibacillus sp. yr247]